MLSIFYTLLSYAIRYTYAIRYCHMLYVIVSYLADQMSMLQLFYIQATNPF